MHFLSDVYVPCEVCHGHRYNRETLEVRYKGKNIYEVLEMTVDEALEFFRPLPKLANKLQTCLLYTSRFPSKGRRRLFVQSNASLIVRF